MHDHPAGRQLRHARTFLYYRVGQAYRRSAVAQVTRDATAGSIPSMPRPLSALEGTVPTNGVLSGPSPGDLFSASDVTTRPLAALGSGMRHPDLLSHLDRPVTVFARHLTWCFSAGSS